MNCQREPRPPAKYTILSGILISLSLLSCVAANKPNTGMLYTLVKNQSGLPESYPTSTNSDFSTLFASSPEVALEMCKLPEIQNGMNPTQATAFHRFVDLYLNASEKEHDNLSVLINEGRPEIRPYSSTLEAIFWILKQDDFRQDIFTYDLNKLLWIAWYTNDQEHDRWTDFDEVTDRLNSPRLLDWYEKKNFEYKSKRGSNPTSGSARSIFKNKRGNCWDYATFDVVCLRKAGYPAKTIRVNSPTGGKYHVVCEFVENDQDFIIDNAFRNMGIMRRDAYKKMIDQFD
jgi:predicted transglutaminase-like cysteine proteinase